MPLPRPCPICLESIDGATLFLDEHIDRTHLSEFSFASRKDPEYMRYKLVRCLTCQLVYAPSPPSQGELANAYHAAEYDSAEEANDAAKAYIRALGPILGQLTQRQKALEIGAGTGVLLELLKEQGFTDVIGVEPSTAAISAAPPQRRGWLLEGIFDETAFEPASFDLICCFMTMEHVHDPLSTALAARRLLRPGGAFVTVTHDYNSSVNRLLGSRSPIIDIEHMQIFSQKSILELFKRCDYKNISAQQFKNYYSPSYWVRLAPLPRLVKSQLRRLFAFVGIDRLKLGLKVGNTITVGFR
jgi:SAM-dependent methyltransferase